MESVEQTHAVRTARFDLAFWCCFFGSLMLTALATTTVLRPHLLTTQQELSLFSVGCALPFLATWRRAIIDGRLPATPLGQPKHDHITGWGFLALAFAVCVIVALAAWATSDANAERQIDSEWGVIVVFGLAVVFILAAVLPLIGNALGPNQVNRLGIALSPLSWLVRPFGSVLSFLDSILVFAVAGGAGASQPWLLVRYAFLLASIVPCAVLGYWLPAPWGLIPIAWGFIVAISISRRWAWIEDDREIYMLNRRYNGAHVRVGFAQDLRDEALLSFMSMFFLVPLALRQAHLWSLGLGQPLFNMDPQSEINLLAWIGYYGTELAKAVPFVDWAEIYQVEGQAPIEAVSAESRHVVFATRIVVDLVFLAALLQALSISARNAKQMDLFKAGVMDRLDPFIEPREFRRLVSRDPSGTWAVIESELSQFPKYDAIRLAELSAPEHYPLNIAARALRKRDGSDDSARFHEQLLERAFHKKKDADAIDEVLTAIRMTDSAIDADDLDRVRIELNNKRSMNGVRENIARLLLRAADPNARFAALKSILIGESAWSQAAPNDVRDAVAPVRRIALNAIKESALTGDPAAIALVDRVAATDPAGNLKREARAILESLRRGIG
ncbi:MAG: hypothetical protein AB7P07_12010 [Hyphomonadaceae bacterium]